MKRRIFNTLVAMSLLLFVATAGLWVRSLTSSDIISFTTGGNQMRVVRTCPGWLSVESFTPWPTAEALRWDIGDSDKINLLVMGPSAGMSQWGCPGVILYVKLTGVRIALDAQGRPLRFLYYGRKGPSIFTSSMLNLSPYTLNYEQFVLPFWVILAVFLVLPLARASLPVGRWWVRKRRLRRLRLCGLCPVCGYDLRAHKPGERCPECGSAVPAGHVPKVD